MQYITIKIEPLKNINNENVSLTSNMPEIKTFIDDVAQPTEINHANDPDKPKNKLFAMPVSEQ